MTNEFAHNDDVVDEKFDQNTIMEEREWLDYIAQCDKSVFVRYHGKHIRSALTVRFCSHIDALCMCVYLDKLQSWNTFAIFISTNADEKTKSHQLELGIENFKIHAQTLFKDTTYAKDIENFVLCTNTCFNVLQYW